MTVDLQLRIETHYSWTQKELAKGLATFGLMFAQLLTYAYSKASGDGSPRWWPGQMLLQAEVAMQVQNV